MDFKEIKMIDRKIRILKKAADDVMKEGGHIEAVNRNVKRIMASVKMLEMNICDINEVIH